MDSIPKARAQSEDTLLTPVGAQALPHPSHSEQRRLVALCGWTIALAPLQQEVRLFLLPYPALGRGRPLLPETPSQSSSGPPDHRVKGQVWI